MELKGFSDSFSFATRILWKRPLPSSGMESNLLLRVSRFCRNKCWSLAHPTWPIFCRVSLHLISTSSSITQVPSFLDPDLLSFPCPSNILMYFWIDVFFRFMMTISSFVVIFGLFLISAKISCMFFSDLLTFLLTYWRFMSNKPQIRNCNLDKILFD